MSSFPQQNKDHNLITKFLHSIRYKSLSENKPYGNTLSILRAIFKASGQQHLLYLVKLRKLWFEEIDNFMGRNAYPRNISILRQFTVNSDFCKELAKAGVSNDFLLAVEKLNGESFKHSEQFNSKLQRKLKRLFSTDESELLKHKVSFKPQQTILHLTVYDGSIAQALRYETEVYLRIFNKLLPELKLDKIDCHVGDLGQAQNDQRQVALLAKDWHLITPQDVYERSMPAFIHRISRGHAVLVLYVSTEEGLEYLKRTTGSDWLVRHLQKKRIGLQEVMQKIALVSKPDLDLEQIRLRSVVLGNNANEKNSSVTKIKTENSSENISKKSITAKEQFAKIRKHLKEGNSFSGNSV